MSRGQDGDEVGGVNVRTPRSCWKDYWVAGKKGLSWGLAGREGLDSSGCAGKEQTEHPRAGMLFSGGGFASLTIFFSKSICSEHIQGLQT